MLWALAIAAAWADDPAARALDAVVLLVQGSTWCAGAIVDEHGQVATAYHCVASGGKVAARTRDGQVFVGEVSRVSRADDLAVLDVPGLAGRPWIPMRETALEVGEVVSALGHPYGLSSQNGYYAGTLQWSLSRGVVSAVGDRVVQFSAPINPGNSGGPVVDADGRLVAVVSRRVAGGEGLGFGAGAPVLSAVRADSARGQGPIGGTWLVSPVVSVYQHSADGSASAGLRLEIAARDRVVFAITGRLPLSGKLAAVDFGAVTWAGTEARLGVRQRIGRGRFAPRIDLWGGACTFDGWTGEVTGGEVDVARTFTWSPLVGGTATVGLAGFDLGATPDGTALVASLVLHWPRLAGVF